MRSWELTAWIGLAVAAAASYAQSGEQTATGPVIAHPEALAGRWEAANPAGSGTVGMNIRLDTVVDGAPKALDGQTQRLSDIAFGLFHRTGPEIAWTGFNYFTASAAGGAVWDGHRLSIHLAGHPEVPKFDVELEWNERDGSWSGLFLRDSDGGQVVLRRPAGGAGSNPFAGTWYEGHEGLNNCVHIADQAGGGLTSWADDVTLPGQFRYGNGLKPPERTYLRYGDPAKASVKGVAGIRVELRAYTAICCLHAFRANLSADGRQMTGEWIGGPNQPALPVTWKRMEGESCAPEEGMSSESDPPRTMP